jgi:hypothetical protein
MTYFHQRQYHQTQRANNLFSKKKTKELQDFKSKCFLNLHKKKFVFKMQDQDFKIHSGQIFFHQTENGRNEKNGYLKTIIWQSC